MNIVGNTVEPGKCVIRIIHKRKLDLYHLGVYFWGSIGYLKWKRFEIEKY